MLDAHSEALQNSTCCRPWVPGWCHPSVHQSLQSQRYLASIAWCQMILAHVLDFLCTDWNQCSFMLSIDCAASFYLRHGSKIVRTICRGSSYLIKSLAISGLSCAYLAMTLGDAVTLFFGTPCPGAITSLHFSHGHILVIWELDAGVYLGVCWICSERRSSCSVKSKALRASQLKDVKGKNLDTFDIRAGSGLFFQGTRRSASQRVGGHEQLICNQTSLVNRKMWIIVSIYICIFDYICWFMMIYVWRVPCKRDEYIWIRQTVRHIEHKFCMIQTHLFSR